MVPAPKVFLPTSTLGRGYLRFVRLQVNDAADLTQRCPPVVGKTRNKGSGRAGSGGLCQQWWQMCRIMPGIVTRIVSNSGKQSLVTV